MMIIFLLLMTVIGFIYGSIREHGDINAGGMYTLVFMPVAIFFGLINFILIAVGSSLIKSKLSLIIIFSLPTVLLLMFKELIVDFIGDNLNEIYWVGLTTLTILNIVDWILKRRKMIRMH